MTRQHIIQYVKNHPAGKVKIAIADIDGILRGKYISADKFLSIAGGSTQFCNVIFGWDSHDALYDNAHYTGWQTGYPDAPAKLDLQSFRKIPWENGLPFFLGELTEVDGNGAHVDPRQLVKKILAQAQKRGFTPLFSQEFEWFNFAETPQSAHEKDFKI